MAIVTTQEAGGYWPTLIQDEDGLTLEINTSEHPDMGRCAGRAMLPSLAVAERLYAAVCEDLESIGDCAVIGRYDRAVNAHWQQRLGM